MEATEQLAWLCASVGEPGVEGGDGVGLSMLAVGDADELAAGFGVGLGLADADEQAFGFGFDVGEFETGELGATQGRGEADQDERGIACSSGAGAIDRGDHAAFLLGAQWSGLLPGCGAEGTADAAADSPDSWVGDRVGVAFGLVLGGDRGAGALDGPGSSTVGSEVGEVGADRGRGRGHRGDPASGAPAFETSHCHA